MVHIAFAWRRRMVLGLVLILRLMIEADGFTRPSIAVAIHFPAARNTRLDTTSRLYVKRHRLRALNDSNDGRGTNDNRRRTGRASRISRLLSKFSLLAPVWTLLAALYASSNPSTATFFGSANVIHNSLWTLMFAMGLAITPSDITKTISDPKLLAFNALLCYGMVPILALLMSKHPMFIGADTKIGLLLLGSVSGGQASNLFTMISGGNVALSVICTLSTTILGVIATPLLAQLLLGETVFVDVAGVIQSVSALVILPLVLGLGLGQVLPARIMKTISPALPFAGILATMILVAGGASSLSLQTRSFQKVVLPSCLLSLVSGVLALVLVQGLLKETSEASKRALVIETMSKSPTLAYVLACRHFGPWAASVPAAAMVTLAVLGAMVASLWSLLAPISSKAASSSNTQ
eukprot:scaffold18563_cov132-Cylindrotheca_fusiformis.AAC.7